MVLSYNNIILNGFYINSFISFYYRLNFFNFINSIYGFSFVFINIFFKKINIQNKGIFVYKKVINNLFIFKKLNIQLLKIIPIFYNFLNLININFLKYYFIREFKGICFFLNKPSNGQRTWSNARSVKNLNKFNFLILKKDKWVN